MVAFLTEHETALRLGVSTRTLARWRSTGNGPPFVRLGVRRIGYTPSDIESWARSRTFGSRAEELAKECASAKANAQKHVATPPDTFSSHSAGQSRSANLRQWSLTNDLKTAQHSEQKSALSSANNDEE